MKKQRDITYATPRDNKRISPREKRLVAGQSLIELLVAVAVGAIILIAAATLIAPALRSTAQTEQTQTGAALGKELLDNVRVFAEANWHNIDTLATTSANVYFLDAVASSPYFALPGRESVLPEAVATSGLLVYWKFDEAMGTVAYDFSGNNYTGTLALVPVATSSCKVAGCLNFNGSTSYVLTPNLVNPPASITLAAWIKSNAAGGVVFSELGQSSIDSGFHDSQMEVETNNTIKVCVRHGASDTCVTAGSNIVYGQWYHVAMRYDGSSQTLTGFVNGVSGQSANVAKNMPGAGNFYYAIGATDSINGGNGVYFSGLIDDARIYNRALSDAEIKKLADAKIYTRLFYVDNVNRDSSGRIVASGGTLYDPSTKKITVVYGWPGATSSISQYLTRSQSFVFDQTDWSGGANGNFVFSTGTNQYASVTANIATTSTIGSILLSVVGGASGTIDSAVFDTGVAGGGQVNSIMWQGSPVASPAEVDFQIVTSNFSSGPWTFIGPDGTGDTFYGPTAPNVPTTLSYTLHNNARYFRYRVMLSSSALSTPRVDEISVNWSP